jgi:hypothetical protein
VPDKVVGNPPAFRLAVLVPVVSVETGLKTTPIVQELPPVRLVPQLPGDNVDLWKSVALVPVKLRPTVKVPAPDGLVNVTVWVALVVPRVVAGKVNEVGISVLMRPVRGTLLFAPFKGTVRVAV